MGVRRGREEGRGRGGGEGGGMEGVGGGRFKSRDPFLG